MCLSDFSSQICSTMAMFEGESSKLVEKFDGVNFHLWKFKMEMLLASKDLWEIVEGSEEVPCEDDDVKAFKAYQRRCKHALSIIATNLVDKQAAHIQHCRDPTVAWQILCDVHEQKTLSNVLFVRRKFFTITMQEGDDMLDHINKVKALADQLACLDVPLRNEDVVMTLLQSLPDSYDYLIAALETRPLKELTLEYVTARLMHEVTKKKEKESKGEDSALVVQPFKKGAPLKPPTPRTCFICGKVGHIAKNCYQRKRIGKENASLAKVEDEYLFVANEVRCTSNMCKWILDSGATNHMTPQRQVFSTYESIDGKKIFMGDNGCVEAIGIGNVVVQSEVDGHERKITMRNVLHVPKLHSNLLSVSKLVNEGCKVNFFTNGGTIEGPNGTLLAKPSQELNLFYITFKKVFGAEVASVAHSNSKMNLWHQRMGHLNMKSVRALESMVSGIDLDAPHVDTSHEMCETCIQGKQTRVPFSTQGVSRANKVLELVYSDVCGPMRTTSIGGCRFFVTFIDDFSRKVWVYPLKAKSEVFAKFLEWKALVEAQSEHKIKALRTDNGGEFISKQFDEYLKTCGIERQVTPPYTPQLNGVAERMNRTLVEMARCMLFAKKLDFELWAEAVVTAAYTRNRCPTQALEGMTPEEAWSGKKPHVSHMRVFGCIAYAKIPDETRGKLDSKTIKCILLGYCVGTHAYKLLSLESKKIIKSRDVVFIEGCEDLKVSPSGRNVDVMDPTSNSSHDEAMEDEDLLEKRVEEPCTTTLESENVRDNEASPSKEPRYPRRDRRPLGEWWKIHILPQTPQEHANIAHVSDPCTLNEALNSSDARQWEQAMDEEYEAHMLNGTWELAPLPKDRKSVGCKWVFRTKRDANGQVLRYKARLVAKGFTQVEGIDFHETFAPVAKFTTIRCMVALGAALDLVIHQMDVKTAFLNPFLKEDIYMDQPKGFEQVQHKHLKCKLRKTIYGLRQSGREWYMDIQALFTSEGFIRSYADHSLFVKQTSEYILIVIVYVDDLIMMANNMETMDHLKHRLEKEYNMTDLGELHHCLGIEFKRDRVARTITLSQKHFIQEVLERFGMQDCKPIGTPLDANSKLVKLTDEEFKQYDEQMQGIPYKQAVGALMYIMVGTRPDLAFAQSVVSQHMSRPGPMHWAVVKRVMRYLKGTMDVGLCLGGKDIALKGYCDADWAGDASDRRSTTGYVFMLGNGAISWNSKRQPTIALSTTEAEYMAASQCCREAFWLRQLLADVGLAQVDATRIMCDNQGCIALAKNPTHHSRTKHIDVQHHFIREKIEDEVIHLEYCSTQNMVADVLTKALTRVRHREFSEATGLRNFDKAQSGSVEVG